MRLGCFLAMLAIGLIAMGTQGVYVGVTNWTPKVMTYQEFLRKKPTSGWIEISDARLNVLSAISESNRFTGTIKQVYIPVESTAAGEGRADGLIHILLSTKDEAILKTMRDLRAATGGGGGWFGELKRRVEKNTKDKAKAKAEPETPAAEAGLKSAMRFTAQNADKLVITRPARGLIQFGLDSDRRDRAKIQALDPEIAADFAVLEDGARPELAGSLFMVIAGLGLAVLLIAQAAAKPEVSTPPEFGSADESAQPGGPHSPAPPTPS
jgi:hypothetical protein